MNPDTLALLALGEDVATAEERTHLEDCSECRARLGELADAAAVGRTVMDLERLAVPPDRVWDAIARELRLTDEDAPPRSIALLDRPAAGERPADAPDHVAPPHRRRARRLLLALAAVVVLLVAGTAGTVALLHAGDPTVVAHADLKHLPGWSGSSGRAEIDQYADGRRVVVVTTNLRPTASADHEVWLMDAATGSRIGLGFLKGPSGAFVLPKHVDLATYSNIDVSAEPHDGDPAPSGPSIIRGPLGS